MTKVLITGGAGFIASHLIDRILKTTDWDVVVLDRFTYQSNGLKRLKEIGAYPENPRVKIHVVDVARPLGRCLEKEIGPVDYLLHLAAGSHVDGSIACPRDYVESNIFGTFEMLEYARRIPNLKKFVYFSTDEVFGPAAEGQKFSDWARYNSCNPYSATKAGGEELALAWANTYGVPVIITHCHDEKTRAFTPNGSKKVDELSIGDKVWALKEDKLVSTIIREIVKTPYSGPMVQIQSNKISHCVTPNHRELIQRCIGSPRRWQKSEFINAEKLLSLVGRIKIPTGGIWTGHRPIERKIKARKHPNCNILKIVPPEILYSLIGWYAAEGSTNGLGTISISNKKKCVRKKFISFAQAFGLKAKQYGYPKICVNFNSVSLADFLEKSCGRYAKNKKLPLWALSSTTKYLQILFDSLIDGDGSIRKNKDGSIQYRVYYTKSRILADQVAELGIKLGYCSGICRRMTWDPNKIRKSHSWIVRFRKNIANIESKHISSINYSGYVWCLRTDEGNFFIERDGKISCSGNTMNVMGQMQHREKYIPRVVRAALDGTIVQIHTDPLTKLPGSRNYFHAQDVADAILFLLNKNVPLREKYNIAGRQEVSNLDVVLAVEGILRVPISYKKVNPTDVRPGFDVRYGLNGEKMAALGWTAPHNFEKRLREVVEWMCVKENRHWLYD